MMSLNPALHKSGRWHDSIGFTQHLGASEAVDYSMVCCQKRKHALGEGLATGIPGRALSSSSKVAICPFYQP